MVSAESEQGGLGALSFVNPHRGGGLTRSSREIPAGDPRPLRDGSPVALEIEIAGAGRMMSLPEWHRRTSGTSLVVLVAGEVVHEWYAEGCGPGDLYLGASMTKSALAHLVGIAVSEGVLDVDSRVVDHVPELATSGYAECRVRDLLTMTTGVDWAEDYRDPGSLATRLLGTFAAPDGDCRSLLAEIGPDDPPGTRYTYCTADSQVLDWVRERVTGRDYVSALTGLWATLGCTDTAVVGVDGRGVPLAGGGLAATSRDWARIGLLQLHGTADGTPEGRRVLDPDWLEASSVPSAPYLRPGRLPSTITTHAGFGFHWWPLDDAGRRVTADGSRGQFAYVDRDLDTVVVKTSQWPYDDFVVDRQARDLSYLGLPEIARAAHAA